MDENQRRNISKSLKGRIFSDEHKKRLSEAQMGEKNHRWKGGKKFRNRQMPIYRKIMLQHIEKSNPNHKALIEINGKKYLRSDWIVHHKNSNNQDNRLENLQLMTRGEHTHIHSSGKNHPMYGKHRSEEWEKKHSERMKGEKNPFYGKHHSSETKKLLSKLRTKKNKKRFEYKQTWSPSHPLKYKGNGYVPEHRLVMEDWLRENEPEHPALITINGEVYLNREWIVHHIDGNEKNNDIINLKLFENNSLHVAYHHSIRKGGL